MIFNKGPRFNSDKVISEKGSDASAPATSRTTARPASRNFKPPTETGKAGDDRYATLLRRIEDLERVHADDKKIHQAELDRQISELARLTNANAEQADKLEKLKKQNDAYEVRAQELDKTSAAEQAELKELRTKLRMCEHERNQLSKREAEHGDAKKALSNAETKRREEIKERDWKVAELEKTLAAERKKRELLESCLDDVRKKADDEAERQHADSTSLQQRLEIAQKDGEKVRRAAEAARGEAEDREEELLVQLERGRMALSRVAEEYARLASTTVTAKEHATLKEEHLTLQLQSLRLERKLANSEGQVTELAYLIRQTNEESKLLFGQLRDAEDELVFYSRLLLENGLGRTDRRDDDLSGLENKLSALWLDIVQNRVPVSLIEYHAAGHDFYLDLAKDRRMRVGTLENAVHQERSANRALEEEVARHVALREASNVELQRLQTELAEANRNLANEQVSLAQHRQSRDDLQDKVNALQKQQGDEASQHKVALQREREMAQKLSMQLRMSKTAEDTLKAEMEQLNDELTEACRFQDAYYKLLDETEGLLARNNLAEEEAERLSRFNAEILGHHNSAQRIVYVDRIRRELADTKQKLVLCTRERDALAASNDDLCHEMEMYKSSVVPIDSKPRSLFIRVSRPQLTDQSVNARSSSPTKRKIMEHLPGPGDMTLDELMQ